LVQFPEFEIGCIVIGTHEKVKITQITRLKKGVEKIFNQLTNLN